MNICGQFGSNYTYNSADIQSKHTHRHRCLTLLMRLSLMCRSCCCASCICKRFWRTRPLPSSALCWVKEIKNHSCHKVRHKHTHLKKKISHTRDYTEVWPGVLSPVWAELWWEEVWGTAGCCDARTSLRRNTNNAIIDPFFSSNYPFLSFSSKISWP